MLIETDGVRLFCYSEGTGPTLAFLHALGLDHTIWKHQYRTFRDRYRVVGIDLRGHGRSDKPPRPYTIEAMAADVAGLLTRGGMAPAVVVGLSIGGMIAMAAAANFPQVVRALAVVAATSEYDPDTRGTFLQRAVTAETQGMDIIAEGAPQRWFTPAFLETNRDEVSAIVDLLKRNDPRAYAAACRAVAGLDIAAQLHRISCPTLIVAGEHDPALPPPVVQRLATHIRGARFETVPGASHLVPVERPDNFNRLLEAFLDTLG